MRKKWIVFLLFSLVVSNAVFSVTITELEDEILKNSSTIENAKLNYESTMLSIQKTEIPEKTSVSAGIQNIQTGFDNTNLKMSPTISIEIPGEANSSDNIQIDGTVDMITPSSSNGKITYSHSWDFSYDNSQTEISNEINKIKAEQNYNSVVLDVKAQLYSQVKNIITYQNNIYNSQIALESAQNDYDNSIKLGEYDENSLYAKQAKVQIEALQNSLESNQKALDLNLIQFKAVFGTDYSEINQLDEITVKIPETEENTTLILAELEINLIQAKINELTKEEDSLSVGGNFEVNGSTINGGANLSLSYPNWNITGSFTGGYNTTTATFVPELKIGFIYKDNSLADVENNELESLNNELLSAQLSYNQSKTDFLYQLDSLNNQLNAANFNLMDKQNQISLSQGTVEQKQTLFDLGLCSEEEKQSAEQDLVNNQFEYEKAKLELYSLQNNIDKAVL